MGAALKGDKTLMPYKHRFTLSVCLTLLAAAAVQSAPAGPKPSRLGPDLYMAIGQGNMAAVKALLSQGADPEAKNKRGQTPLSLATTKGNDAITSLLHKPELGK